jgi:hypothetical protein
MEVASTQAYFDTVTITTTKKFNVDPRVFLKAIYSTVANVKQNGLQHF